MVEDQLKRENKEVYCLGELIHNPEVMKILTSKGLKVISDIEQVKKGIVFTRTHGVNQIILEKGTRRGLRMVETTCPYVSRVQKIAQNLAAQSYYIIVIGDATHPEIKAVVSNTPTERLCVIKAVDEIDKIPPVKKIGVVAQTTESLDNFKNIMKNLIESCFEIRAFNTICKVVRERQKEIKELANKVEAMIVVGGRQSSNTRKLADLCKSVGVKTYLVESESDIDLEQIKKLSTIGIAGGTSTPEETIKDLKRKLSKLDQNINNKGGEKSG